jgi:hypothetical protein
MTETTALTRPSVERRDRFVVPALLIASGGLFLLSNLGVIAPISLRTVLSLWPLIPVLIGIDMAIGRDRPALALGLQIGALLLGLTLVVARAYVGPSGILNDTPFVETTSPAIPGAPEVAVSARDIHFSLGTIVLPAREVDLTLRNDGVLPHDLTIPGLGVHIAAEPGESVTVGLRDLPRGRYDGFCSVSGHTDAGMRISVRVD